MSKKYAPMGNFQDFKYNFLLYVAFNMALELTVNEQIELILMYNMSMYFT